MDFVNALNISQPLSTKISSLLITELRTGEFAKADRLPSELELAGILGVSRTVVRDALSQLEREGLIERGRGVGTLINRAVVDLNNRIDLKFEYNQLIKDLGFVPATDSVKISIEDATVEVASKLNISPNEKIIVCEKRVLASGSPAIYSVDFLALSLFDGIIYSDIDWSLPIFDILESYCGIFIETSVTDICACCPEGNIGDVLQVSNNSPLIMLTEVSLARHSRPVMYSVEYYTQLFKFSVLRKKF